MTARVFPSLVKSCRLLLPPLFLLSACGEGLPESESAPTPRAAQQALYEDLSCQGVLVENWTRDSGGWTVFPDPALIGGRKIYVSNPLAGTTDEVNGIYHVTTVAQGVALLRKGSPDALYLARGQRFVANLGATNLGGTSISKPMVIRSFGTGVRPVLQGSINFGAASISHLIIADLDIQGDGTGYGVYWARSHTPGAAPGARNILFENVRVQRFQNGLTIQSFEPVTNNTAYFFENVSLRRSAVLDNWGASRSQGLYAHGIQGLIIEDSVFDHNGFRTRDDATYEMRAGPEAHNMYLHSGNRCVRVVGNVSANAASHGLQARAGGVVHNNLLVRNPLGMSWGLVNGGAVDGKHIEDGVTGSVVGNVLWESQDINSTTPRDGGIELGNARNVLVQDNVMAHHLRGNTAGTGIIFSARMGIGLHNMHVVGNKAHNMARAIEFNGSGWGPVTIRTDGSVASPADVTLITAAASGLKLRSTPTPIADSGSVLADNYFSRIRKIISHSSTNSGFLTSIDYSGNSYDCLLGTSNCTSYGSLNEWLIRNGETGYKIGLVPFVDSDRSLSTYLQMLYPDTPVRTADQAYADFMNRLRDMEKRTWDARYMGSAVSAYLRAGFAVQP
ncbi:hypothetical protein [Archangium sp.]|uniref:hypothetical protein n=1 Tax=Archangium sp. TaxID=1872627 RepID=UPI002D491F22|nr:hypothetical protein [Archangium sp.]HYO57724.1 hypothetical protein [Archangium sp.]